MSMHAETRLYASAIAIVSGVYSIAAEGMGSMAMSQSIMLIVGAAALVQGIVLLTPAAERIGRASGPLMVLWASIMLGNQALAAMMARGSNGVGRRHGGDRLPDADQQADHDPLSEHVAGGWGATHEAT